MTKIDNLKEYNKLSLINKIGVCIIFPIIATLIILLILPILIFVWIVMIVGIFIKND